MNYALTITKNISWRWIKILSGAISLASFPRKATSWLSWNKNTSVNWDLVSGVGTLCMGTYTVPNTKHHTGSLVVEMHVPDVTLYVIKPNWLQGWHYGKGFIYLGQYFNSVLVEILAQINNGIFLYTFFIYFSVKYAIQSNDCDVFVNKQSILILYSYSYSWDNWSVRQPAL